MIIVTVIIPIINKMKKLVLFSVFVSALILAHAQNAKPTNAEVLKEIQALRKELQKSDSINKINLTIIADNIDKPRYKIYQTENIYNLLKLDTRTGRVWIVQYSMNDVESGETPILRINGSDPWIVDEESGWDGRFELYPTKNMYNFILLDSHLGRTYQVQWSTDPNYRFIEGIW